MDDYIRRDEIGEIEHTCEACPGNGNDINDQFDRRGFIKVGGGLMSLAMSHWLYGTAGAQAESFQNAKKIGKANRVVLLWMNGGPSHIDTFDPKPNHRNGGSTRAIATSARGVKIGHYLPRVAEQAHHLAIVRSMVTREANHSRGQYLMHTGYTPLTVIQHPSMGSIVSKEIGGVEAAIPNFVSIRGNTMGAGFLGVTYNPLNLSSPDRPPENLTYFRGVNQGRFQRRLRFMNYFENRLSGLTQNEMVVDRDKIYTRAVKMMQSHVVDAFNIDGEPAAVAAAYGDNEFGRGCLLARRLLESGVRFVEVGLGGWDTHDNNFQRMNKLARDQVDPGMSTLIADLSQRGLLRDTLVIWMGEFGRTPRINSNEGRDHWADAFSVVLAGGPVRGGQVIGQTDDGGEQVSGRPVNAPDLFATFCHALGINYEKTMITSIGSRYSYADIGGKPVMEVFGAKV